MKEIGGERIKLGGGIVCWLVVWWGEDVMPMGQTGDALETLAVGRTSE